jgi:hypothetical protein
MVDAARRAGQHRLDAAEIDQPAHRLCAGDPQHQVVGVVFAQRVIKDIGRKRRLPPGLAAPGHGPFDQPGDNGRGPEGALHHRVAGQPGLERRAQPVGREERPGRSPASSPQISVA